MILIYGKGKVGNGVASLCAHIGIPYEIRDDADPTTDFSLYSDIIPSPGIPAKHPVRAQKQCISELDFAYRYLPKGFTIMAVTGTDGKSTTCWILSEILRQEYGKENVFLSGNFDVPFSRTVRDILEKKIPSGFIVVEVSSFMSSALSQFRPDYSIFTNFVEDHLNWHPDLRDYFLSKWHLFEQTKRLCVTSPAVLEKAKEFGAPLELPLRMYGDQYPDKIDHNAIVLAS
jgi:UDP-N-acetylmuramoylalanine--D-glutamate ligase